MYENIQKQQKVNWDGILINKCSIKIYIPKDLITAKLLTSYKGHIEVYKINHKGKKNDYSLE